MKQGKNQVPDLDLDALEREIAASSSAATSSAAPAASAVKSNDPLAELARIMGQDSPFAGLDLARSADRHVSASSLSLDDILNAPPSSGLRKFADEVSLAPAAAPELVLDQPAMVQSKADKLSPDPVDDELAGEADHDEVKSVITGSPETLIEKLEFDSEDDLFKNVVDDESDDIDGLAEALDRARETVSDTKDDIADTVVAQPAKQPQFDDMLAEFESAMRDVGGEKVTNAVVPSLAPVAVPPPPEQLWRTDMPDAVTTGAAVHQANEDVQTQTGNGMGLAGAAAAGAAVIAAGTLARGSQNESRVPRRGFMIAGGVVGIAFIGILALFAFGSGPKKNTGGDAPVIAAKSGVTKERPANPGGVDVPNQDKEILKPAASSATTAEKVAPREEQPVDLKQAQAAATPAVRQIPGVAGVPAIPVTTPSAPAAAPASPSVPASPSIAGSQPVPRPVASVPITIAGQPAPTPAPAPVVAIPAAPAPVVAAPPVASPAPQASAPVPTATAPATTPAAAQPAAPRKVRTVPIREGEGAPARTAAQPRVAPAEEPDAGNAPMRITPQALRGSQRVAAAAPAVAPAESSAETAQPARASGGSGFSVQLGAEGNQDAARAKFNRVKDQHSGVLGGQNANIRNAEVNGRTVYRIRVGNMSRDEAVGMCERLKADGGSCFVAKN